MPTIIDGYNLLRTCGFVGASVGPGTLERARGMLLGFLAQVFPESERSQVSVVFDSALRTPDRPDHVVQNGVHVHYASGHRDADEMIIDMIQRHSAPKSLLIVSSDHQIQIAAKRRKARFCDADHWYETTCEANRSNPQVVASVAELKLERQLRWKELGSESGHQETEAWREEFQELLEVPPEATKERPPTPSLAPEAVDLRPRLPSDELKHGPLESFDSWVDSPEWLSKLETAFQATDLGPDLRPSPEVPAAVRPTPPGRAVEAGLRSAPQLTGQTPLDAGRASAAGGPESESESESASSQAAGPPSPGPTGNESKPFRPATPHVEPSPPDVAPVTDQQLQRWNRQLQATDQAIFPPGYGEDIVFSESFEIDHRLKRKPRRP